MTYAPEPTPLIPHEVSVAANSIGWSAKETADLDLSVDVAIAIAQRLYDQGLLKVPS